MAQHRITSPGEKELVQQTTPEAYGISIPQTRWVVENTWFSCYFDGWIDFVQKSPAKDAFFMGFFMAIEFSLLVFCTMGWSLDWSDHIRPYQTVDNWGYPHDSGNLHDWDRWSNPPCTSLWRIFSPRHKSYLIERTVLSFGDPKNYANGMCVEQMGKQM